MTDKICTLLLSANGVGWRNVLIDTIVRGMFRDHRKLGDLPESWKQNTKIKSIYDQRYKHLSYVNDWHDAFFENPNLEIEDCNINNLIHYGRCMSQIKKYDFIAVLHSANGDNVDILLNTRSFFQRRKGKLLVFIGNEYNWLSKKLKFINDTEAEYIASQLPIKAAKWLYSDCQRSKIIEAPHALNPQRYYPIPEIKRTIDVGFIGSFYSYAIGDIERRMMLKYFQDYAQHHRLKCHIQNKLVPSKLWNEFLNQCKGCIGAESGTYYLEKDDYTLNSALEYLKQNPNASFKVVYEQFYKNYKNPVNGKCISSRHFEPIGTKTCQILLEGEYNGILEAEKHYISVKKDLSDVKESIERFKDESYRNNITETAYEYVLQNHTYQKRVDKIIEDLFQKSI